MVSETAELKWSNQPPAAETSTDSDSDSQLSSSNKTDGNASTEDSNRDGSSWTRQNSSVPSQFSDPLRQDENNIILEGERHGHTVLGPGTSATWGECVEQEEANWCVHFPPSKPFIKPPLEQTDDGCYQGEDCVNLFVAKKVILPTPDGSLALKQDCLAPPEGALNTSRMTWKDDCHIQRVRG